MDGTSQGIPALIEGNARVLGDALREKGFRVTQPQVRMQRSVYCAFCCKPLTLHSTMLRLLLASTHTFQRMNILAGTYQADKAPNAFSRVKWKVVVWVAVVSAALRTLLSFQRVEVDSGPLVVGALGLCRNIRVQLNR